MITNQNANQGIYDYKSDSSSRYIRSAFSAQRANLPCLSCKRRFISNNFILPTKGQLNINPFNHNNKLNDANIKRNMSGPNF